MLCYTVTMRTRGKEGGAKQGWPSPAGPSLQVCSNGVNSRKAGKGGEGYEIRILGDAFEEIIA